MSSANHPTTASGWSMISMGNVKHASVPCAPINFHLTMIWIAGYISSTLNCPWYVYVTPFCTGQMIPLLLHPSPLGRGYGMGIVLSTRPYTLASREGESFSAVNLIFTSTVCPFSNTQGNLGQGDISTSNT